MKVYINICNFSVSAYSRVKLLTGVLLLVFCHSAFAQRIVLGGNPPGSQFYPISQAISSVVTNNSELRVDVLPQGGSVLYPMMQTDEVDLAVVNPMDALSALKGEGSYERPSRGNGFPMLTVMLGSPIALSLVAAANTDIRSAADLAGQRVVADYGAFASAGLTAQVVLAAAGLDLNDVDLVTVSSYPEGVRAVIEGRAVASTGSVGSSIVRELEASRGAKYLEVKNNFATTQVIKKLGPAFYPFRLEAGQPGVEESIWVIAYDIPIVARPNLEDETIYKFVSAVWDYHAELGQIYNPLETWTPERFASTKAIIPYHPGAIRFYRDKGVWTNVLEAHNQSLIEDLQ